MTGGVTRMAAATHDTLGTYRALFLGSFAVAQMAVVLRVTLRPPAGALVARPSPARGADQAVSPGFPLTGPWFFVKNRPPFRAYLTTRLASQ